VNAPRMPAVQVRTDPYAAANDTAMLRDMIFDEPHAIVAHGAAAVMCNARDLSVSAALAGKRGIMSRARLTAEQPHNYDKHKRWIGETENRNCYRRELSAVVIRIGPMAARRRVLLGSQTRLSAGANRPMESTGSTAAADGQLAIDLFVQPPQLQIRR
jgi:hypothetical protein